MTDEMNYWTKAEEQELVDLFNDFLKHDPSRDERHNFYKTLAHHFSDAHAPELKVMGVSRPNISVIFEREQSVQDYHLI